MTPVELLLPRLNGVRQTRSDRWIALCPAHEDRSPSLSIGEVEDGKILINCFAGCGTSVVLDAVGLRFGDLFPDMARESVGRHHQPDYKGLVFMLSREAWVCVCAATATIEGRSLSPVDFARLVQARQRLNRVLEVADVRP